MQDNPIALGTLLAVVAAVAFGVTTPLIQRLGAGIGPLWTASLLYLGAALGALPAPWRGREAVEVALGRRHLRRLVAVALLGAAFAPALLAWGLQRVSAVAASLLLNGEALVTVGLAGILLREHVGRRVALAAGIMGAGGVLTVLHASADGNRGPLGALAILLAVCCWALDNVLTRPLAELDPAAVVRAKAMLGALLTAVLALASREIAPTASQVAGLLACGATGYGLSLRLYLLAQRRIGAGRTGSVFALGPFIGAAAAVLMGDRSASWETAAAAALFALGVTLHLTERHEHEHAHEPFAHDHLHRHDDGHHGHPHDRPQVGSHSHPHEHRAQVHSHAHAPDVHHRHGH